MDELNFEFIYNGRDSFIKLERNRQKDMYLYKINFGKRWKGWIEIDGKKIYIESGLYFFGVTSFVRNYLNDRKNVSVKIYLFSS